MAAAIGERSEFWPQANRTARGWRPVRGAVALSEIDRPAGILLEHAVSGKPVSTFPDHALAVEPQQVVPGETESADGCFIIDAGMRPVPIVAVQPERQLLGSLPRVLIGLSVSPLA